MRWRAPISPHRVWKHLFLHLVRADVYTSGRERVTGRQTDRQTDRQTGRITSRCFSVLEARFHTLIPHTFWMLFWVSQ